MTHIVLNDADTRTVENALVPSHCTEYHARVGRGWVHIQWYKRCPQFISSNVFTAFKKRLATASFDAVQKLRLNARLNLVDSFLQGNSPKIDKYFKQGSLVIVDLTDPFIEGKGMTCYTRFYAYHQMIKHIQRRYYLTYVSAYLWNGTPVRNLLV